MADTRPANCRFRLKDEGKPYGRSSCAACRQSIFTGLSNSCAQQTADMIPRAQAEAEKQLAVAAALREAAECCTVELRNTAMLSSKPPQSSAAWDARNAILALLPNAGAALDRALADAEARGMDRSADIAKEIADQFLGYMSRIERAIRSEAAGIRAQGEAE
ncbi:hypothetical protein [Roseicyclus marinus]|uniref:hypothetical protein n=1 Tax=Roseicyclus marinus TaxID=2161673 RepID=UPI00240FABAA|nr:hypothetical protein [Roseicyclus marinus]MDG3040472.1 hypothetical protein [Roseicyclus marinus]